MTNTFTHTVYPDNGEKHIRTNIDTNGALTPIILHRLKNAINQDEITDLWYDNIPDSEHFSITIIYIYEGAKHELSAILNDKKTVQEIIELIA